MQFNVCLLQGSNLGLHVVLPEESLLLAPAGLANRAAGAIFFLVGLV